MFLVKHQSSLESECILHRLKFVNEFFQMLIVVSNEFQVETEGLQYHNDFSIIVIILFISKYNRFMMNFPHYMLYTIQSLGLI